MTPEEVDRLMLGVDKEVRLHWCFRPGSPDFGCACTGCADVSGGLRKAGVTFEEWEAWTERHPDGGPSDEPEVWVDPLTLPLAERLKRRKAG